jgi:DNA-binding NarL/FixJ family response regulator
MAYATSDAGRQQGTHMRTTHLVLIVEDHERMRAALRDLLFLELPHCTVLTAADANQALTICELRQPDVVLMDIQLGEASGIDLTAAVRRIAAGTSVIIVTSLAAPVYAERAQTAGAFAYVLKDRLQAELVPFIIEALQRREICA